MDKEYQEYRGKHKNKSNQKTVGREEDPLSLSIGEKKKEIKDLFSFKQVSQY